MFYVLRANMSISALGIRTQLIAPEFRQMMQNAGMEAGNTPQEVAIRTVSQLPLGLRLDWNTAPITRWIRQGKVNPDDREMRRAFLDLGISERVWLLTK